MKGEFEMSMMGEFTHFLCLQICKEMMEVYSSTNYTKALLKKYKIENCKAISTPMASSLKLDKDEHGKSVDKKFCRGMIGSLLYLTASRSDIIFATWVC
ncbi:hypothetical protein OROMI_012726 [Orobanche minor]